MTERTDDFALKEDGPDAYESVIIGVLDGIIIVCVFALAYGVIQYV